MRNLSSFVWQLFPARFVRRIGDADEVHRIPIILVLLTFSTVLPLFYCKGAGVEPDAGSIPDNASSYYDDVARLLAGLPLSEGSELSALTQSPGYAAHRDAMQGFWQTVEHQHLRIIQPWQKRHISAADPDQTALYLLSGADFLNLHSFFPDSRRYVLVALEESGRLPGPSAVSTNETLRSLEAIRAVTGNIGARNYFMSASMNRYLNGDFAYRGTTPVILIFAVRLGFKIHTVEPVVILDNGTLRTARADEQPDGSRIQMYQPEDRRLREIVYLQMRLSDENVSTQTDSGRYLHSLGRVNVMLKSAVYLLHMRQYTGVRDFVLQQADFIIQDDSGVPYSFFQNDQWEVRLFGTYTAPVRLSGTGYFPQPQMAADYNSKAQPIEFQYGYGTLRPDGASNLLLARRVKH